MSKKKYNKLVRDKIPEILEARGKQVDVSVLDDKAYLKQLVEKLYEEVEEFDEDHSVEEIADVIEVLAALAATLGISQKEIAEARIKKAAERGTFKKR
ncbi:MAG TPA: nucleoside triphosphate pyrophosphohydrolase, partial [Candidatus Saccharimonadales bacterium]|nr:nucleoside triphosphate pyrophosphohydrolase [Candidatus Saccharimonadales bacterium]